MAYSFQTFTLAQVLTAAQMNQVEVNIRDHEHNVDGVASIKEGAFEAAAVDQAALKTTTASGSTSIASGPVSVTLTGGTYSWWTASSDMTAAGIGFSNANVAAGVLGIGDGSIGDMFYRDERYVQASPPYTHGPLFVFLLLDTLGNIINIEVAPDPPWAYHGPTDIRPKSYIRGVPYSRIPLYDGKTLTEVKRDAALFRAVMVGDVLPVYEEHEITLEYKDSDMNVVPHYWIYNKAEYMAGRTAVLLEPGTTLMGKLYDILRDSHAHDVRDLIRGGYLTLDNSPILLPTQPVGVSVIKAGWRKTS